VAVAVDLPRLELDRPFTYRLPDELAPGTGLLVSVPFHGRTVHGWVLGPTDDVPARILAVRRVLSRLPLFDERSLALYRWMSERYVVPLSLVIGRAHPPRVATEEGGEILPASPAPDVSASEVLATYEGGLQLLDACRGGSGNFVVRPLPDEEAASCVEAVKACVSGGRDAVVVVPEAAPLPATARAVADAFGSSALLYVSGDRGSGGGQRRERYRRWLDIAAGRYRVVVGTRPAVFAPVRSLGLVWIHRDAHPGHREERAPRHHTRDVALARARIEGAVCVLAGLAPGPEATAMADDGAATVVRAPRARERTAAPLVEAVAPAEEDRSPRLGSLLRSADGGFLLLSRRGYGVARRCRACGAPVRCVACSGPVAVREGRPACLVCGTEAACATCGSTRFGVERGGTERLEEWTRGMTSLPVTRVDAGDDAVPPVAGHVVVGTAAAVKDFGPRRVPLVAVLDADRARHRAGLDAASHALATWMEAAAWAGPRGEGGRVLVHTREPGDPAVQALVRWDPWIHHRAERRRREEAGFPPGFPVFRVAGRSGLDRALAELQPAHLLSSDLGDETVCLVTLRPGDVKTFRKRVVAWADEGLVTRVEAEPQL
jgi:primosomal protein N' (replication factor Y)